MTKTRTNDSVIDGSVIGIPEREPRENHSRVFRADNQDSDWRNGLIGLAAFAIASAMIGYAFRSVVVGGVMYTVLAILTVLAITGVLPAIVAMLLEGRTESKALDIDSERIEAQRQVLIAQLTNTQQLQAQQHDEAMKRLEDHGNNQQLLGRLAHVEQAVRDGRAIAQRTDREAFTAAVPDPARDAARAFVARCYTDDGYNNDIIWQKNGGLRYGPWNREWAGEEWAEDAMKLLVDCVLEGSPAQYRLRYDNVVDADNALRR